MSTIGTVTKQKDGSYVGELRTLSVQASITVVPVKDGSPLFQVGSLRSSLPAMR